MAVSSYQPVWVTVWAIGERWLWWLSTMGHLIFIKCRNGLT
jgi:hypothetical protein